MKPPGQLSRRPRYASAGFAWTSAAFALLTGGTADALDCTFFTSGVAFGVYDGALATPTDSTGNATLRCTHVGGGAVKTSYTIALSRGASGTFLQRQLRAGNAVLNYNLYTDATRTQVWGDGSAGSAIVAGTLLVNPGNFVINEASHPIYGRIPAQQSADSGIYADQILVTLTF
jgi:spore coat protein U-like protein